LDFTAYNAKLEAIIAQLEFWWVLAQNSKKIFMKKIVEYKVIKTSVDNQSLHVFGSYCNKAIRAGFIPYGQPILHNKEIFQAMIRFEKEVSKSKFMARNNYKCQIEDQIDTLKLPTRTMNALKLFLVRNNLPFTIKSLCNFTEQELFNARNVGRYSLQCLKEILSSNGFSLRHQKKE